MIACKQIKLKCWNMKLHKTVLIIPQRPKNRNYNVVIYMDDTVESEDSPLRSNRTRRKPLWMSDYVTKFGMVLMVGGIPKYCHRVLFLFIFGLSWKIIT